MESLPAEIKTMIANNLSFYDLKSLRAVNNGFCSLVSNLPKFQNKAKVIIGPHFRSPATLGWIQNIGFKQSLTYNNLYENCTNFSLHPITTITMTNTRIGYNTFYLILERCQLLVELKLKKIKTLPSDLKLDTNTIYVPPSLRTLKIQLKPENQIKEFELLLKQARGIQELKLKVPELTTDENKNFQILLSETLEHNSETLTQFRVDGDKHLFGRLMEIMEDVQNLRTFQYILAVQNEIPAERMRKFFKIVRAQRNLCKLGVPVGHLATVVQK